ncbi:MAG: 23S rRNA (pseudouridine(1915)-N(3))-methyltransferase RlmH [Nitrospirota bacterium]
MGLVFLFVGKTKEGFIKEGIGKYLDLLRKNKIEVEVRELKGSAGTSPQKAVEDEGEAILERVLPSDFLVALDERGMLAGSVELAGQLGALFDSGRRVIFAVGGPFGLAEKVKARSGLLLSLSRLTFTHEMARLILLEQVYRSITITRGRTYHY